MRILIDNGGYTFKNNGDSAMLVVIASRFKDRFPDAEIHIFTEAPDRLKKIIPYAIPVFLSGRGQWGMSWNIIGGIHKLFPVSTHSWLLHQENLFKLKFYDFSRWWIGKRLGKRGYDLKPMWTYLDEVEQADIVVASGGGYITDPFEGHACNLLHTLALAQSFGKLTAMFGQGLGPVSSKKLFIWTKKVLCGLDTLSLREGLYSKPLALSTGVPAEKINVTGDDAIALVYSKTPSSLGNAIGINLRVASYSGLHGEILSNIKNVLDDAITEYGTELRPIPISGHDADSDVEALRFLLADEIIENAKMLDTPEKVIEQVAGCRIVITGSYHAGVFALSQGVSVIGVAATDYYRHKFEGLANQFGDGCVVVDRKSADFIDNLQSAINKSWNDAEITRSDLLKRAQMQIKLSESVYGSFIEHYSQYG